MKTLICTAIVGLAAALPTAAVAQAAAPAAGWSISGNAGLFSDYRFRGFTQTGYKPALQGGIDIAHNSGFYVGNWNSNVEQGLYNGASLEMDFYGGYKGSAGDLGYDLGYIFYLYPNTGAQGTTRIKNGEWYVGASFGPISAKWYYASTKFFSLGGTRGSWYLDLAGTFDLGDGWAVAAHYGYQSINDGRNAGLLKDSVGDYKLGVTKDLSGWVLGASVIGTSEKLLFTTAESGFSEAGGKARLVMSVTRSF